MSSSALRSQSLASEPRARDRPLPIPYRVVGPAFLLLDFFIVLLLAYLSGATYHLLVLDNRGDVSTFLGLGAAVGGLFVGSMQARGRYRPSALLVATKPVKRFVVAWITIFAFLVSIAFLMKISDWFSRGFVFSFFVAGLVTMPLWRMLATRLLRRAMGAGRVHGERVVLIGQAEELAQEGLLENLRLSGYEVWQAVPLSFCPRFAEELRRIVPGLVEAVREQQLSQILIAASWANLPQTEEIARVLQIVHLPVRLLPDRQVRRVLRRQGRVADDEYALELKRSPLTLTEQSAKRCIDLVLAATTIVLLAPLLLVSAVAIRIDSRGPALFRQKRVGFSGRVFRIYKFRTMTVLDDGPEMRQATANDVRVTRVGRWLRRTSIDELPQLFNVITGDMSLVGPRPHATAHDSEFDALIGNYALRHHVKPGITGCAQVRGFRGETSTLALMQARVEHDLWYIDNWSLALDLKVMLATIREVIRSRNAY